MIIMDTCEPHVTEMLLPAGIWWATGVPNKGNLKPSKWKLIREGHPRMAIFTGEKRWFMKIDEKSITRSVEECENKDTPHTSQNFDDYIEWRATKSQPCAPDSRNQSISEQAQVRYKLKNYNKKWLKKQVLHCIGSFLKSKVRSSSAWIVSFSKGKRMIPYFHPK